MDSAELEILKSLDAAVRHPAAKAEIDRVVERVRAALHQDPARDMAWEPLSLDIYSGELPDIIRSSWVFILRAHTVTGAERHPNSHQRMMAYDGSGDFQTRTSGPWQSNVLTDDPTAAVEGRWISIPRNVWHQSAGPKSDWTVVSFHEVEADELIEERPGDGEDDGPRQMKYVS